MTPKQLMSKFNGSRTEAAKCLGYTPQRIGQWVKCGKIPRRAQELIEAKTVGALKADRKA